MQGHNMKIKMISISLILTLSGAAQANVSDGIFGTRLSRKANRLARKLETSQFELKTDKHDQCAVEQLKEFLKDRRHSTKQEREAYISSMNLVNSTTINQSIESGVLTGERDILTLEECHFTMGKISHRICYYYQKIIGENLSLSGKNAQSQFNFSNGKNMYLTTEYLSDKHITVNYQTRNRYVYLGIDKFDSPEFKEALDNGSVYSMGSHPNDDKICGSRTLKEFIGSVKAAE